MSNVIINPTSDAEVIRLGERVQRISAAKALWYAAVNRYLDQGMNTSKAYMTAVQTLVVNGYWDVTQAALTEIRMENTPV